MLDELKDIQVSEALKLIIGAVIDALEECLFLDKKQINEFLEIFLSKLPQHLKNRLVKPLTA